MAIVQISRITNRKGLTENLPQLAGAELGWCTDSRRLFIGNGTIEDGAPEIGNTEILTQYSDFVNLIEYVYSDVAVGYAAQTGPTPSTPTVRTISQRLDDIATVRNYGAVGDGIVDDTDAIERALYDLYCRETTAQVRRSLFFPAGVYRITRNLQIPTWATLIGEGQNHTIILMDIDSTDDYVARFVDNMNQTGANIGNNGATTPRNIEISSMTFASERLQNIFLIDSAFNCWFSSVAFNGPLVGANLTSEFSPGANDYAAIRFSTTPIVSCQQIVFDKCAFSGVTYGFNSQETVRGVTVSDSTFDTLYQGIVISGNVSGFRTVHNFFDNVYLDAIVYDSALNVSAKNIFYNVGNALGSNPIAPIISFGNDNNLSIADLFSRNDDDAIVVPRVEFTLATTVSGGSGLQIGRYARDIGRTVQLVNGQTSPATILTVSTLDIAAFTVDYMVIRGTSKRKGQITIMADDITGVTYSDEFVINLADGVTLSAVPGNAPNTVDLIYTSTNTGIAGTITYSLSHLGASNYAPVPVPPGPIPS